jgi:hypothetical protein
VPVAALLNGLVPVAAQLKGVAEQEVLSLRLLALFRTDIDQNI